MAEENPKNSKGRVAQVGAATLGTILVYVAKIESVDPVLGQIVIYATPFVTILTASGLILLEEYCRATLASRKAKRALDDYIIYCDSHLKDENLNEEHRKEILSKRNQIKMAAINDGYSQVLKNFPSGTKAVAAVKKSNRKAAAIPLKPD